MTIHPGFDLYNSPANTELAEYCKSLIARAAVDIPSGLRSACGLPPPKLETSIWPGISTYDNTQFFDQHEITDPTTTSTEASPIQEASFVREDLDASIDSKENEQQGRRQSAGCANMSLPVPSTSPPLLFRKIFAGCERLTKTFKKAKGWLVLSAVDAYPSGVYDPACDILVGENFERLKIEAKRARRSYWHFGVPCSSSRD